MGPQELVDLELLFRLMVLISYPVFDHEHLQSLRVNKVLNQKKVTPRNLTDIRGFEHLLVVQSLL